LEVIQGQTTKRAPPTTGGEPEPRPDRDGPVTSCPSGAADCFLAIIASTLDLGFRFRRTALRARYGGRCGFQPMNSSSAAPRADFKASRVLKGCYVLDATRPGSHDENGRRQVDGLCYVMGDKTTVCLLFRHMACSSSWSCRRVNSSSRKGSSIKDRWAICQRERWRCAASRPSSWKAVTRPINRQARASC